MHVIPVISAHPFPLCFFANPSLHIRVSCLCISFSIYEARSNVQGHGCTLFCRLLLTNFPLQHIQIRDNAWQFGDCGILPLKWRNWKPGHKYCSPQVRTTAFKHQWKSISLRKCQKYHKHKVHSKEIYTQC